MQQDVWVSVRVGENDIVDLLVEVIRLFDLWSALSSVRMQSSSASPADVGVSPEVRQHLAPSPLTVAVSSERNLETWRVPLRRTKRRRTTHSMCERQYRLTGNMSLLGIVLDLKVDDMYRLVEFSPSSQQICIVSPDLCSVISVVDNSPSQTAS